MKHLTGALFSFGLVLLISCSGEIIPNTGGISPDVGTNVAQTQTASIWTATPTIPTATPVPKEAEIINVLNGHIRNVDKLAELIEAEYFVASLDFIISGNPNIYSIMRINIVCESMTRRTCTPERGFVLLMHSFEAAYGKDKQRAVISSQVPETIQTLQVTVELAHAESIGSFVVSWDNVKAFASGDLTPEQLDHEIIVRP